MITLEQFNKIPDGQVFETGTTTDTPDGCNMTGSGKELRWLAKKGYGDDWTIYCHWAYHSWEYIKSNGDKVKMKSNILKLVPCDEEVYNKYRM